MFGITASFAPNSHHPLLPPFLPLTTTTPLRSYRALALLPSKHVKMFDNGAKHTPADWQLIDSISGHQLVDFRDSAENGYYRGSRAHLHPYQYNCCSVVVDHHKTCPLDIEGMDDWEAEIWYKDVTVARIYGCGTKSPSALIGPDAFGLANTV
ncbi:hypothetical protein DFH06DRAFT_1346845 [Mycena polygramma]|nr:hypothetical protein DFH06DRAFT_1346845 [Mycena polygramma]